MTIVAVAVGTTSWRLAETLDAGEVAFSGTFRYDAAGNQLMIWDAGIGNMRAMTDPEAAAYPAQKATASAQAAKAAATSGIDNGQLVVGDKQERIARALLLLILDEINILRAAVLHPVVSITRSGNTATATTLDPHGLSTGDPVRMMGATLAAYNVAVTATVTNAKAFTYPVTGTPTTPAVGSIFFAMGAIPATQPRTVAELINTIKAKIAATAE